MTCRIYLLLLIAFFGRNLALKTTLLLQYSFKKRGFHPYTKARDILLISLTCFRQWAFCKTKDSLLQKLKDQFIIIFNAKRYFKHHFICYCYLISSLALSSSLLSHHSSVHKLVNFLPLIFDSHRMIGSVVEMKQNVFARDLFVRKLSSFNQWLAWYWCQL